MSILTFREEVTLQDTNIVRQIVNHTDFFSAEEELIAVSLVQERLDQGVASGYLFVFAQQEDYIVGYSCYGPIPGTLNGFDLYWIAVDPEFQRLGTGRRLLAFTEQRVVEKGGKRLYAETSSTAKYAPTRAFYEHHGFILEGRLAHYYAPEDDKLMYVKYLEKKR